MQVGYMLQQKLNERTLRTVQYWSRPLNNGEQTYDSAYWEGLIVVWAFLLLRPYIKGDEITMRKNHETLQKILN